MNREVTAPRAAFLRDAKDPTGVHAVEEYKPAQWAIAKGYVTVTVGRMGGRVHRITPAGEAALLRAGET